MLSIEGRYLCAEHDACLNHAGMAMQQLSILTQIEVWGANETFLRIVKVRVLMIMYRH